MDYRAELMDNVEFIYEVLLAEMELDSLDISYTIHSNLKTFKLHNVDNVDRLLDRVAYFKSINGEETLYQKLLRYNVKKQINQYLTHWIYPYKGKFHPQMIRALLNIMKLEAGDTVLDPFIGSGTTAVESQILGINCIGVDISPICVIQSRVKTESIYVVDEIRDVKDEAMYTFRQDVERGTSRHNKFIESINDRRVREFYILAKLLAVSDNRRRGRDIVKSYIENLNLMIKSIELYREAVETLGLKLGDVYIELGDARNLNIKDESIDGVVTSPPYTIALDYIENDIHAYRELGYNPDEIRRSFIGLRGSGEKRLLLYNSDMMRAIDEVYRVLRRGGYAVFIVGDATYQGRKVETIKFIDSYSRRIGFSEVASIDKVIFGTYNYMRKERILVYRKPE